jgi:hypothetical protein
MKFNTIVETFLSKEPAYKLGNQEAADRIVDVLNDTDPDEVASAVIEALNRFYTLDNDQSQALAAFFDQHLSD